MTVRLSHVIVLAAITLGLGAVAPGCVAQDEDIGGITEAALDFGIEPVGTIPEHVWRELQQGCEGMLDELEDVVFARAENAPALGVALDGEGEPVCVDSWAAIHAELEDIVKGDPSPDPMDRYMRHVDE